MKMNKKGFTLIEMLVVIAVIAVLVSIVIPTVSSATEKAKLATDAANIRAAVATVTTESLANGATSPYYTVTLKSSCDFSKLGADFTDIGGLSASEITTAKGEGTTVTIYWDPTAKEVKAGSSAPAGGTNVAP